MKINTLKETQNPAGLDNNCVVVPPAFHVLTIVFSELINKIYHVENYTLEPSMDDNDNYGLKINRQMLRPAEIAPFNEMLEDIDDFSLMQYAPDEDVLFFPTLSEFFQAYIKLAKYKGIDLALPEGNEALVKYDLEKKEFQDDLFEQICTDPDALNYIHSDQGFISRTHLTRCFLREATAHNDGAFIPTYSLSELEKIMACHTSQEGRNAFVPAIAPWLS